MATPARLPKANDLGFYEMRFESVERLGIELVHAAVDCCFFPVYEVEKGKTTITYDPEARGKRIPLSKWLGAMGKTRHLLKPEYSNALQAAEREVERRWRRLRAMHEHPLL